MTILIFKPLNCFSKTTSKLQMISKGITKIYKNKITSIKKKTINLSAEEKNLYMSIEVSDSSTIAVQKEENNIKTRSKCTLIVYR